MRKKKKNHVFPILFLVCLNEITCVVKTVHVLDEWHLFLIFNFSTIAVIRACYKYINRKTIVKRHNCHNVRHTVIKKL